MAEVKLVIAVPFHRFVAVEAGKPERKETFAAGQTVTVPEADAEDWVAKGLARPVAEVAPSGKRGGKANRDPDSEIAAG